MMKPQVNVVKVTFGTPCERSAFASSSHGAALAMSCLRTPQRRRYAADSVALSAAAGS
jgi:hypothetical protein